MSEHDQEAALVLLDMANATAALEDDTPRLMDAALGADTELPDEGLARVLSLLFELQSPVRTN